MTINSIKMYISEKNLIHNMDYLTSNFNKKVLAVVKSNAYGHDINLITKVLVKHGYCEFAVARLVEALKIINEPETREASILIFESIGKKSLKYIKNNKNLIMSVNTYEELEEAISYGISPKNIQLKIDFGFGRNGIYLEDIDKLKIFIGKNNFKFSGIYSHLFSVNYEEGLEIIKKFTEIVNFLGKERFGIIHLQNSAAIENFGSIPITTHIRPGMLIYGLQEEGFYDENLKQVFSLEGEIAGIRDLSASRYVAYNLKSNLNIESGKYIAKVKIGYGDGFLKINENTQCLIGNKEFYITLVTMDNSFIEVDSSIKEGDKIVFYPNVAFSYSKLNMAIYELLTILSPRVKRVLIDKI